MNCHLFNKKFSFFLFVFVAFFAVNSFAGLSKSEVIVYKGKTPVLDGYLSPGEYDDASTFSGMKTWYPVMHKTTDDKDLSIKVWVKHDGENLYFAFDVTDNILYAYDIDRWLPDGNKNVHDLTRDGWPWFGDGLELLVNASNSWDPKANVSTGDGSGWQMVCSTHKSRLGGVGKGGLLEGEPRAVLAAWENYQKFILSGAMKAVVRIKTPEEGHGYYIEWMIKPNPCLEVSPGKFWTPDMGPVKMGLNIGVQDLDNKADGAGWENIRHEDWWASYNGAVTAPISFGTMILVNETKTSVFIEKENDNELRSFTLDQNYPNPFNPSTTINFQTAQSDNAMINIFNTNGQIVKTLMNHNVNAGNHSVVWDGKDNSGNTLSAGAYIYKLETGNQEVSKKMLFIK